jgi:8-oxo-dGTP pyrophosphatase MutT (NUDIX family)
MTSSTPEITELIEKVCQWRLIEYDWSSMELLKEIVRLKGLRTEGSTIYREAVRGIIIDGPKLLLIHSRKNGDYKFPGGGIIGSETHQETLAREIREECGTRMTQIGPAFGKVIEYDTPMEADFDVFQMTSYYYLCQVEPVFFEQQLEQYEHDLGFEPVWICIDDAMRRNRKIARSVAPEGIQSTRIEIRWLSREIFVLEQVRERLFHNQP